MYARTSRWRSVPGPCLMSLTASRAGRSSRDLDYGRRSYGSAPCICGLWCARTLPPAIHEMVMALVVPLPDKTHFGLTRPSIEFHPSAMPCRGPAVLRPLASGTRCYVSTPTTTSSILISTESEELGSRSIRPEYIGDPNIDFPKIPLG